MAFQSDDQIMGANKTNGMECEGNERMRPHSVKQEAK
jgi:hypothetical protein